jgi:hypothetical protein
MNIQEIIEKNESMINEIKSWVMSQQPTSNYIMNLQQVFKAGYLTRKHVGLVVSAVHVYNKAKAIEESKKRGSNSQFIGNIGDKISIKVKILFVRAFDTNYGTSYLYNMMDEAGNVLVWFASKQQVNAEYQPYEVGNEVTIAGTIKDHKEYNGTNQTALTRCKMF